MLFEESRDEFGLPAIEPHAVYDSIEAAELLQETPEVLRKWRFDKSGPRYSQKVPRGRVTYLGQWLIEFRYASIKDPVA